MKLTNRKYKSEDYPLVRAFLCEALIKHNFIQKSWHVARWDYWRWHVVENLTHSALEDVVRIWETPSHKIAAVLHPEGIGDAFLDILPEYLSRNLVAEMVATAEEFLFTVGNPGKKLLTLWSLNEDPIREPLLKETGYQKGDKAEYVRWRELSEPIPDVPVAEGYQIRTLKNALELPDRSWASWKAFHPEEPDSSYQGWEWYLNVQRAPGYRRDLDLVAVTEEDQIAGFCTVWFDEVTKTGVFEPVGVTPAHKRHGLGKALMFEGLRKLIQLEAFRAYVGSYEPIAHALYESAGFIHFNLMVPWKKEY